MSIEVKDISGNDSLEGLKCLLVIIYCEGSY